MAPPRINEVCRRIVPLGGKVVVEGENFAPETEVFVQILYCHSYDPLEENVFGDGSCWSMFPGYSVGLGRVLSDSFLEFTLPVESRYLTHMERYTTLDAECCDSSHLEILLNVPGEGYSNLFPYYWGLTTVPRSSFDDPADVHSRPLSELEDLLLDMINEIRGWNDKDPVAMNADLRNAARAHAQLMNDQFANGNWVGETCTGWEDCSTDVHQAPGESSPRIRVEATGLDYVGENVDFRWKYPRTALWTPIKETAEFWDNSCGHRQNLLSDNARLVGIGISRSIKTDRTGNSGYYYTYTLDLAR